MAQQHQAPVDTSQFYKNYLDNDILALQSFELPGDRLGTGGGGFAGSSVNKVRHRRIGRLYAMKTLGISRDALPQIAVELRVLDQCRHPQIISFFGSFIFGSELRIVVEYMDVGSLDQVLKRVGSIDEAVVRHITLESLLGLQYLRDVQSTFHRDVKPGNILVNSLGHVKLCDFGSSRINTSSVSLSFMGTQMYMAPEIHARKAYRSKSDIWSLGITIIEIATGRFPFPICDDPPVSIRSPQFRPEPRQNILALHFHKMLEGEPPRFEGEPPRLPHGYFTPQFEAFVGRCCVRDLENRGGRDELLGHDWILLARTDQVDMAAWATGTLLPQ